MIKTLFFECLAKQCKQNNLHVGQVLDWSEDERLCYM